jgi:creatinine amidohydrolase/Fe(II)-dependent formamide hydrolase-like protein
MIKLEDLSSSELRRAIESGLATAVVPFGSVEGHGGHLPLGSDALLADFVGEAVAERLDAVLAPTVRVGCAAAHMQESGTLSMPPDTLRDVSLHVAQSLITHGFRVIVLVSTHGGNQAVLEEVARQLNEQHQEVLACAPRGDVGPAPGARSGKWLTSVMLVVRPDLVDVESADADIKDEARTATAAHGAVSLERFVSAMVETVRHQTRRLGSGGSRSGRLPE